MLPDRVSNPGPLTYESGALPIALRGPGMQLGSHRSCLLSYNEGVWGGRGVKHLKLVVERQKRKHG